MVRPTGVVYTPPSFCEYLSAIDIGGLILIALTLQTLNALAIAIDFGLISLNLLLLLVIGDLVALQLVSHQRAGAKT
jgi:hypothetical protein